MQRNSTARAIGRNGNPLSLSTPCLPGGGPQPLQQGPGASRHGLGAEISKRADGKSALPNYSCWRRRPRRHPGRLDLLSSAMPHLKLASFRLPGHFGVYSLTNALTCLQDVWAGQAGHGLPGITKGLQRKGNCKAHAFVCLLVYHGICCWWLKLSKLCLATESLLFVRHFLDAAGERLLHLVVLDLKLWPDKRLLGLGSMAASSVSSSALRTLSIYLSIYPSIYLHKHRCMHIHIYIYICIHTYIHKKRVYIYMY